MYLFRGQIYDIDDVGEYSRFMSPSGLWLELVAVVDRYYNPSGSVNFRAFGAFQDSATRFEAGNDCINGYIGSGRNIITSSIPKPPSTNFVSVNFAHAPRIVSGTSEIARTKYGGGVTADSIELHWLGLRLG